MTNDEGFSVVFCSNCGKENPEESKFCTRCGQKFERPSGISNTMLVVAGCAAAVSMSFALLSFYKYRQPPPNTAQTASPTASVTATPQAMPSPSRPLVVTTVSPLPTPSASVENRRETVVNDSIVILPRQFQPYRFEIKNGSRNAHLTGRITATGGGDDDIFVLIVDDQGLQEFSQGGRGTSYYRSKVREAQSIDVTLGPGVYHLIFSNVHAKFFKKLVRANMYLEFDRVSTSNVEPANRS